MTTFQLKSDYITLAQLLKESGIIGTGGQAKFYLQDHPVQFNGVSESRRGKKCRVGDTIVLADGQAISIVAPA